MAASKPSANRLEYDVDEQSPLLRPSTEDDIVSPIENLDDYIGGEDHEFKSSWHMFLLTLGGFGYVSSFPRV